MMGAERGSEQSQGEAPDTAVMGGARLTQAPPTPETLTSITN